MAMPMPRISNKDIWNAVRDYAPNFKSVTAEGTAEMFTAKGFEEMKLRSQEILNDFYLLSVRVWLNEINVPKVHDMLEDQGFGEKYDNPWGAIAQRIAIENVLPTSPSYNDLKDGDSPDQFVVRKPKSKERFFQQNFDYQSVITLQDQALMKDMFVQEYGLSDYIGGIMEALLNGFKLQKINNKLEAIGRGLNSTDFPLQEMQQYATVYTDGSQAQQKQLWLTIANVIQAMTIGPTSSAFNAYGFDTYQEPDRLVILIKPGFQNAMNLELLSTIFNPDRLSLKPKIITVPHFGGLIPHSKTNDAQLFPVYDNLGSVIGFAPTGSDTPVDKDTIRWDDPNADIIAVIADKGYLFETVQNPYSVEPARNVRGLYTNFWASSANNGIYVDHLYNVAVIRAVETLPDPAE